MFRNKIYKKPLKNECGLYDEIIFFLRRTDVINLSSI